MQSETSYGIIPLKKEGSQFLVLLIHQKHGDFWGFPKGHPEEGESAKQAAERELFEEVGLGVDHYLEMPSFFQSYTFQREESMIDKKVELFAALTKNELVVSKKEVFAAKWIAIQEALTLITYETGKNTLEELERRLAL